MTVRARELLILAPCLRPLPRSAINQEKRFRNRCLDMIMNPEVGRIFRTRARIISLIRRFLEEHNFIEVETPILTSGGAAEMCLRISPELRLKEALVGGLDRIYEIGKQFRSESIDRTHHPEFTSCEFYAAYSDYESLMCLVEEMLSGLVHELTGGYLVKYHSDGPDKDPIFIDFTPPFRRMDMLEELEKECQITFPRPLSSEETNESLKKLCERLQIHYAASTRTASLFDKLVGHFLEVKCINPTFIMNHPLIMSPLAKASRSKPWLSDRFELFVNQSELLNGYTEENDPEQMRCFKALEYGLNPCAGCGIGIDHLVMLLTDTQTIKEVILFPTMKPTETEKGGWQ